MRPELSIPTHDKHQKKEQQRQQPNKRAGRQLGVFLIFLLLSSLFWLLQTLQRRFVTTIECPLVYDSIPMGIAFDGKRVEQLSLVVEDQGFNLLRYALEDFTPIALKLSRKGYNWAFELSNKELKEALAQQLAPTARILSLTPSEIMLRSFQKKSKKVPLLLGEAIVPAAGYSVGEVELSPTEITIYGPRQLLDTITQIRTKAPSERDLKQTTTTKVALDLPDGVEADISSVQLHIPIDQLTQATLSLPILIEGTPPGRRLYPLPSSVSLQLTLPRAYYDKVQLSEFEVSIAYPEEGSPADKKLQLRLTRKPSWVTSYKLTPDAVQYVIESE